MIPAAENNGCPHVVLTPGWPCRFHDGSDQAAGTDTATHAAGRIYVDILGPIYNPFKFDGDISC